MENEAKIKVGISIGDMNGIGPEIILKTFEDNRMLDFCIPIVYANSKLMSFFKKEFKLDASIHGIKEPNSASEKNINVINVWNEFANVNFGKEEKTAGEYAIKSLRAAVKDLKSDKIDVLVTAPINKSNIQSETFNFPGHTNFLEKELKGDSLMLMVNDTLRIGLLTDHVAIKDVSENINRELIDKKINTIHRSLVQDFSIRKPKIAVLSINPHSGDKGVIGKEDDEVLKPALDNIRHNGKLVFGPYAADSFFGSGNYQNFDAIIASYHDQGLTPFKTLSFGKGVNYTAGLHKVRTSPDHGTAYDIAGKNEANFESFKQAVFTAIEIYKNRQIHQEISKNPLEPQNSKSFGKKNLS